MAHQYRQGRLVPAGETSARLRDLSSEVAAAYRRAMDALEITQAAASVFRLIDGANLHIADTAPWALAKDPSQADRLTQVLFDAAEAIRLAAVLLSPIMPASSREILRRVGATSDSLNLDRDGRWRADGERVLVQDASLWPRFDKKTAKEKLCPGMRCPTQNPELSNLTQPPKPHRNRGGRRAHFHRHLHTSNCAREGRSRRGITQIKKAYQASVSRGANNDVLAASPRLSARSARRPHDRHSRESETAKLRGIESNGMVLAASPEGGSQCRHR